MKRIISAIALGALVAVFAVAQAKLPPAPPKSDAEKKAEADKAAATKAKDAELLNKAMDKAVANYKKNAAAMDRKK
jgi:uncharacterized protein YpmS